MMMTNDAYNWNFDGDDFVTDDDGSMSMDIDSFLSILDENRPQDSSQSGFACPSLSTSPYNASATHVGANEYSQTLEDHSDGSVSRTVCSTGSPDCERQTGNHGLTEMGPLPDVSSTHFNSLTPSDWSVPVQTGDDTSCLAVNVGSSSHYDSRQDFSSSNDYDARETNFESATGGGTFGISDGNGDHQMMVKSGGITDGTPESSFIDVSGYSDSFYTCGEKSSMPYAVNRNEPRYSDSHSVYNNGMLFNDKIALEQHTEPYFSTKGSLLSSESSTDTIANRSTNGSHFPSMLPNRRQIVSTMEGTGDVGSERSCDVADRLFTESVSGVFNSFSGKDHDVKGEQDTKRSRHFINIRNSPFTPARSPHHDITIQNQQVSLNEESETKFAAFTNMGSIGQQAAGKNVTYIDVDDLDISILEDMSEPAPRKYPSVDGKSPLIVAQSSSLGAPPVHMGFSNARVKENDERIVYRVALQDLSQPKSESSAPDGTLEVSLLKHQRIALSWMVQKETKSMHCFGGILADDQGLGKTISTIALILKERSPSSSSLTTEVKKIETETFNLDDDDDEQIDNTCVLETKGSIDLKNSSVHTKSRPAAGTLVVCPTSVLRQWNDELHNKVSRKASLSVLVYHGANRTKDPCELAKYDVVLTTYAIVNMEVPKQPVNEDEDETKRRNVFHPVGLSPGKKRKYSRSSSKGSKKGKKEIDNELFESLARPLAKVRWFRVVLDEAQSIKNHRTQVARACWGLKAKRRWCLSGTPVQNAIDDLYSYFRFLRYDPYAVYKSFCSTIKAPIQRSPATGYKKLQAVLKTIMLRRTKATLLDGEPIINLPPKTINLKKVDFTAEERDFYSRLETDSRAQFEVSVMIMSLKAASLGLNMVSACHVLLLDLWWNPTTEDQAIDRAHRIGQTRPVSVLRLTVKDTVEDRILALQQKKREMVSSAFGEDETGSGQTRLTVDDLRYLFQA